MKHKNIFTIFSLIILITFTFFSCKTSSEVAPPEANPGSNQNTVTILDSSFSPSTITVSAGTTVTWVHRGNVVHTATSGTRNNAGGVFNSGDLTNGNTFQFTFQNPGDFDYHCIYHIGMDGKVIVQ
ncbi:MAG: hypothetical protein GTO45_40865 [Candidatus Aminicenantes bacterium]|nr:hypothetical protein [Candidatus Aminicenantes bacterium]NIM84957.1 hypothetical protein [Candidatus Aminicenantes bacterium]NIN24471.1 hypothetical protein [Candidatus Aminicenantes bacterium]NIN48235.1 hypothetical protein [Candidatus Aminicenantes bacterium]NIN91138.1 hypothetical protein [Candidatus Aminicenantes bacterium]